MSAQVIEGDHARQLLQLIKSVTQDEIGRHHNEKKRLADLLGMLRQLIEDQGSRQ